MNVAEERLLENPFVGLRPFESDESHLFFGREEQSAALLQRLHRHGFVAVVGASGCGKSSLVRAGLVPKLKAGFLVEDRDRWLVAIARPGDAPLANYAAAIDSVLPAKDPRSLDTAVRTEFETGGRRAVLELLSRCLSESGANLLLLVDQFEEIFRFRSRAQTTRLREEAGDFVSLLLSLASEQRLPVYVVITMRSDFIGDCDAFPGLPEALNESQYLVPRLTRGQLRAAIEGPIRLHGAAIQPVLVDRILNDAGDNRDHLPVLQHALMRAWQFWRKEGRGAIDVVHYVKAGTLSEALSNDADEAISGMSSDELELTETLFRALTDTDGSNRRVRRPAYVSEIQAITHTSPEAILGIVDRFRSAGRAFLMCSAAPGGTDTLLDISHESLIRQWERLRSWVDQEKESRDHYLRLVDQALRHAKGQEGLLRDPALSTALDWRSSSRPSASWAARYHGDFDEAMRFLDESASERERERSEREAKERLEKSARRMRWGLWAVAGLAAVLGGLVWFALRAAREADSSRLALHALSHADGELDLALLWSAEAYGVAPTIEAANSLLTVLARALHLNRFLHGHEGSVQAVVFVPRTHILASASRDGSLFLWDVETGTSSPVHGTAGEVQALAVHPAGRFLATADNAGRVILWDVERRAASRTIAVSDRSVSSVAFSPDGERVASGGSNGSILLWDLETDEPETLATGLAEVQSLAFAPNGRILASGHETGAVILWDLDSGKKIGEPREQASSVQSLAFHPEGELLASAHYDKTVAIWKTKEASLAGVLSGHQEPVRSVAFSPDGKLLASASNDGVILLWDCKSLEEPEKAKPRDRLTGHGSKVQSVAFSDDSQHLASGGSDQKVILWDMEERTLHEKTIRLGSPVRSLAFDPEEGRLAALDPKGVIRIVDLGTDQVVDEIVARDSEGVFFSREQELLVATDADKALRVVNVESERVVRYGPPGRVRSVAISADTSLLATGIQNGEASLIAVWGPSRLQRVFDEKKAVVKSVAFSPDGSLLAYARESDVVLRDMQSGDERGRLSTGGVTSLNSVVFDGTGGRIASVTADDVIWLWDVNSRQPLGPPLTGHKRLASVAFSHDGRRLASGSSDGTIWIWDVDPESWQEKACRIANEPLPDEEWETIRGGNPFTSPSCSGPSGQPEKGDEP